jgi:hypothetical protein
MSRSYTPLISAVFVACIGIALADPGTCLEELRKPRNNFNRNRLSPDRYLNSGPPEYEVGMLTTFLHFFSVSALFFFCSLHSWKYAHIHFSPSKCTNTERHSRVVKTLLRIRKVPGSNLGPDTSYPD